MNEPIPLLLAKLERQLGLVPPTAAGDRDRPDPELLAWLDELDPLYGLLEPVPGDEALWARVSALIEQRRYEGLRKRVSFWRGAAIAAGSAAAGFAALAVLRPADSPPPPPAPQIVERAMLSAVVQRDDQSPLFVLVAATDGASIQSTPAKAEPEQGHSYHLWISDGQRTAKIGTISPSQSHSVVVPGQLRKWVLSGASLMVTLDPGEPEALAHDRIVARGSLAES